MKRHRKHTSLIYVCAYVICALYVSSLLTSCGGGGKETIPIVPGQKSVKVTGTVRNQAGQPVSGATVEAYNLQGDLLGRTRSNKDGEWELYLPVGVDITLKISATGYNEAVAYVKPVEGYNAPVDVTLTAGPLAPPPPPVFPE